MKKLMIAVIAAVAFVAGDSRRIDEPGRTS